MCQVIELLKLKFFDPYYSTLLNAYAGPEHNQACGECFKQMDECVLCTECFGSVMTCVSCCLQNHSKTPFHRVKKWDSRSECWVITDLSRLGLCVRILHDNGTRCLNPGSAIKMNIMHTNGMHEVSLRRCGCTIASAHARSLTVHQCLANRLFPATNESPKHAYTFEALDLYHQSNLEAFTNIKQFCDVMSALTPKYDAKV